MPFYVYHRALGPSVRIIAPFVNTNHKYIFWPISAEQAGRLQRFCETSQEMDILSAKIWSAIRVNIRDNDRNGKKISRDSTLDFTRSTIAAKLW
jgi:hypothetical protein